MRQIRLGLGRGGFLPVKRLDFDKYYTPTDLASRLIQKTFEVLGKEKISEVIEPSAGNGSFSLQIEGCIAFDIVPEHESIIQQDFLKLQMEYKKGRLIIGNPPFGSSMNLAKKFFKKSVQLADYIAFILPISQLNNSYTLYEFDLLYSEDLGKQFFTDREVHCCFNIYARPKSGKLNKKNSTELKDVKIYCERRVYAKCSKVYSEITDYDLRICGWGNAGKILKDGESYADEYKIVVLNKELKEKVIEVLKNIDWKKERNFTAMPSIKKFHIYEVLKKYVTGIE